MVDVLFLSNNDNSMTLFNWLISKCNVKHYADKIDCEILKLIEPKLVISYGYRNIIPVECINYMKSRIINLHISYLPWNRGADPNIWSILDGTPKGVTIHRIAQGFDTGDIIYQKQVELDYEKETLKSSYEKLHKEIVDLFKLHWEEQNIKKEMLPEAIKRFLDPCITLYAENMYKCWKKNVDKHLNQTVYDLYVSDYGFPIMKQH